MAFTACSIGGLNVHDGVKYAVLGETVAALEASSPQSVRTVDAGPNPPTFIDLTPAPRTIPFKVALLRRLLTDRLADFNALVAATETVDRIVPVIWTDTGVTKQYSAFNPGFAGTSWYGSAGADLIAHNPDAI